MICDVLNIAEERCTLYVKSEFYHSLLLLLFLLCWMFCIGGQLGQQGSRFVKYIDLCRTAAVLIGEHRFHNHSLDFVLVIWPEVLCAGE